MAPRSLPVPNELTKERTLAERRRLRPGLRPSSGRVCGKGTAMQRAEDRGWDSPPVRTPCGRHPVLPRTLAGFSCALASGWAHEDDASSSRTEKAEAFWGRPCLATPVRVPECLPQPVPSFYLSRQETRVIWPIVLPAVQASPDPGVGLLTRIFPSTGTAASQPSLNCTPRWPGHSQPLPQRLADTTLARAFCL